MYTQTITTLAELRALYGELAPTALAKRCILPTLDQHHCAYIAHSSLLVIGSADAHGAADVSPRGDRPGFVHIYDEHTLLIPDRPGNRKLETLSNLIENPQIALLFLVPGRVETLRITGTAQITVEPALLGLFCIENKVPQCAIVVHVDQVYFHCGKALVRSQLWDNTAPTAGVELSSFGAIMADEIAGLDADEVDEAIADYYQTTLW